MVVYHFNLHSPRKKKEKTVTWYWCVSDWLVSLIVYYYYSYLVISCFFLVTLHYQLGTTAHSKNVTLTLDCLSQKTSSITAIQVIWESPSGTIRQASRSRLCWGGQLGLQLRVKLQQTQQHTVPPRGAPETTEGRGRRHCPETSEDPCQIEESPLLTCLPASQAGAAVRVMGAFLPCCQWMCKNVVWFMLPQKKQKNKKKHLLLVCLQRSSAPLHSRASFPPTHLPPAPLSTSLNVWLQFTSSARNRREDEGVWRERDVSWMECTLCRLDRNRSIVRCTLTSVPPVERKHLPHVVWWIADLYTLILLLLSVLLWPPFIVLFSHIFALVFSVWSGVTVESALQGTDGRQGFTTLLCRNPQIPEHPY